MSEAGKTIDTDGYKGPERRCTDCPVKEVIVEKNNVYWIKLIGSTLFGVLFLALLPYAYLDLKSGVKDATAQTSALSTSIAEIKTTLQYTNETQKATTEALCYLRNRLDDFMVAESKERKKR